MAAKKKLTLYVSDEILQETKKEALRQDRSISWVLETAWRLSKERMETLPGIEELHASFQLSDG